MKILLATSHRSVVGGVETYLQSVIPALLKRGHEVAVICEQPSALEEDRTDPGDTPIPVWYAHEVQTDAARSRQIARWSPDLVYSHCPESAALERFLLDRYACILHLHNYWGTCTTGRKCNDFPHTRACERRFGPACLALHYPLRCGGLNPLTAFKMFQTTRRRKSTLVEYRRLLVSSSHMYREYERHVDARNLRLIAYPVTDAGLERQPYHPKEAGGSLLFAGRLTALKGLDYLIRALPEAARRLNRALTLTVVGDGPERRGLEALARNLGLSVQFAGWLSGERKFAVMRESHLLVVPSRWPEPFALVGIEAGCLSLPAAAYALGGIPDWLASGVNGELAPGDPPTVAGLAEAVVSALADPDHYARLCRHAWASARQFTMAKHVDQLESVMGEVIGATVAGEALRSASA